MSPVCRGWWLPEWIVFIINVIPFLSSAVHHDGDILPDLAMSAPKEVRAAAFKKVDLVLQAVPLLDQMQPLLRSWAASHSPDLRSQCNPGSIGQLSRIHARHGASTYCSC